MKNLIFTFFTAVLLFTTACEDDSPTPTTITANDLNTNIDENPTDGQVIGIVSATTDGSASLTYSMVSGGDASAFAINATTGELTVADATQFDFETNPTLSASYEASNGATSAQGNITVNLNDVLENTFVANDLVASIDENSAQSTVIGTIDVETTGTVTLSYDITSQSISGAVSIDANGQVLIADATAFDYETNTSITGTIKITTADAIEKDVNFTITINDVDMIRNNLSTSQSTYDNASDGDWITVTGEEYNALATALSSVTKSGMPDADFLVSNATLGWSNFGHVTSLAGTSVNKVPSGSYLFAFKFIRHESNNSTGSRVKLSETSETDGFENIGTALPDASGSSSSIHYYVLKGNSTATTATDSYVGFYCDANVIASSRALSSNIYTNTKIGDASTGDELVFNEHEVFFQSLSSTATDIGW